MKTKKGSVSIAYLVKNLAAMIVFGIVIIAFTLFSINSYTRHNESVSVPNIRGMQLDAAEKALDLVDLQYEITDSIYSATGTPGAILEQDPIADSPIKKGRKIFVTTQAVSPKLVAIPSLKDYSRRQALAQLKSLGFEKVRVRQAPSLYADIVLRVNYMGDSLISGQRLAKGSPLELVIGAGGLVPPEEEILSGDEEEIIFE